MADNEKVPDSFVRSMHVDSIHIESRYGKRREIEAMVKMVNAIRRVGGPRRIDRIFCDSKMQFCYAIYLLPGETCMSALPQISAAHVCACENGGHNGITVIGHGPDGPVADVDPWWPEEGEPIVDLDLRLPEGPGAG